MADFASVEETEGLRLAWNVWPNNRIEATKCVLPFGALYTPTKALQNLPVRSYSYMYYLSVVPYEPVPCKSCGAVLNPYAQVDFQGRLWICPLCHVRNAFPPQYQGISEQSLPAEVYPEYTTLEYQVPRARVVHPPAYIFVVDTSLPEDELAACRAALSQALLTLPEYCQLGLVTFGTHVHVHELGFQEFSKAIVFQGSKEYSPQQIAQHLGFGLKSTRSNATHLQESPSNSARFVSPLSECEFVISGALDELQKDAWPAPQGHRPARCTGTALQVAAGLMNACLPAGTGAARLMLFVGGPATHGPGKVVDTDLQEPIRSHKDLAKDSAPHYKAARKLFDALALQMSGQAHALDVFACSLDQVGLAEMKNVVELSGGLVIQTDSFGNSVFKESFRNLLSGPEESRSVSLASNAIFEVLTSKDVRVQGLMGPAAPIEKKNAPVSDGAVGMGGTNAWKLASMDTRTTLAIFFEVVSGAKNDAARTQDAGQFYVQCKCTYLHADGSMRCRVYTFTRQWVNDKSPATMVMGFDQEAAAVLTARLASWKMETEEDFDATRWLDRTLIRLAAYFGEYAQNDPRSFDIHPNMALFPQFMFNLRRSQFVQAGRWSLDALGWQVFGNSPDETAYFRISLMREAVPDALLAIQPSLLAYTLDQPVQPVLLDVASIHPDRILLLDAYFSVVVFHGSTIAAWRKQGFHEQAGYASFKSLLEGPMEEAAGIMQRRFPVPRLVDCDQNGSQARFLLARLNPSSTYQSSSATSAEMIMTDDVSLSVFTEHLRKLAVQG